MNQHDFDEMVIKGIRATLVQGTSCISTPKQCAYSARGLRCVVGHMMADEEIAIYGDFNGCVDSVYNSGWKPELDGAQVDRLMSIQSIHDDLDIETSPERFRQKFLSELAALLPQGVNNYVYQEVIKP